MKKPPYRPYACSICYELIPHASTGRPRLTCGDRCRQSKRRRSIRSEFQSKRAKAARQIARWEKRLSLDFSTIPAYEREPEVMSLRDRLMIYLPRNWPTAECWTCHRPYFPDDRHGSPTCSDRCQRHRSAYFADLQTNFYQAPRPIPAGVFPLCLETHFPLCAHCHDPFLPAYHKKYCSPKCRKAAWAHRNPRWRCRICSKPCKRRNHYCSNTCKGRAVRRREPKWTPLTKLCAECSQPFEPSRGCLQKRQRFCTDECLHRATTRRRRQRYQLTRAKRPIPADN